MGNMSPYYFKTIFTLCMEGIPSFIKIGGAVSEKNGNIRQTFVVLYIGFYNSIIFYLQKSYFLIVDLILLLYSCLYVSPTDSVYSFICKFKNSKYQSIIVQIITWHVDKGRSFVHVANYFHIIILSNDISWFTTTEIIKMEFEFTQHIVNLDKFKIVKIVTYLYKIQQQFGPFLILSILSLIPTFES